MSLRLPNRTAQAATYHTGSPAYVDVSTGSAAAGMVTFPTRGVADSWADGDLVGVAVKKNDSNYAVWLASWDASNEYLELVDTEATAGTLADGDSVTVAAVLTTGAANAMRRDAEFVAETGTARTLTAGDHGQTIRCTSASAVTITADDALPVGFHCLIVQEGAGTVSIAIEGADTLNGATADVDIADQWKSAYLYQAAEGAWVCVA